MSVRAPGRPPGRAPRLVALAALALLMAPLLGACSASTPGTADPSAAKSAAADSFYGVKMGTGALGTEPDFTIGDTAQSTSSLQVKDVVVGSGPEATPTSKVTVQYRARSAKTKLEVDSTWQRGKAFTYDPASIAFKVFTEAVPGMKVGGRRLVIIPGSLAYGPTPPPGSNLQPNETLVYVVDLVSVDS